MRRGALAFSDARFVSSLGCVRACWIWPLAVGGWFVIGLAGWRDRVMTGADLPRCSNDQPRQAAESQVPDCLIGSAGWQMDFDLGFHLDDAGGDLDQAQPEGVELGDPRQDERLGISVRRLHSSQ